MIGNLGIQYPHSTNDTFIRIIEIGGEMMVYSIIIILAIIIAIYLGEKFDINTGLVALAFAYLIGCFVLGMSINDLLALALH